MQPDIRRPLEPWPVVKVRLDCHKQRILRQPARLLLCECGKVGGHILPEAVKCRLQHMQPLVIHLPEIDLIVLLRPLYAVQYLLPQPAALDQLLRVTQIRIARERREALIRRVSVPRRAKRKNLPVFLPRLFEKIHKRVGLLAEVSNAVFRRQGRDMQQDSAASFHNHPSISVICRTLCRVSKRNGTVRCCACAPCMQESSRSNERSASRSTDCAMVVSFGTK